MTDDENEDGGGVKESIRSRYGVIKILFPLPGTNYGLKPCHDGRASSGFLY
jgi:hypothetical protein